MSSISVTPVPAAVEGILELLLSIGHFMETEWVQVATKHRLSPQMASVVFTVGRLGETKVSDLAHVLKCDAGNLSGTVDRLEELGMAERVPSDIDRRVRMLRLSKTGMRVATQIGRELEDSIIRKRLDALAPETRATFLDILKQIAP